METVLADAQSLAHGIVWCTMATVDRQNRPRSRVVHPLWETRTDHQVIGWVATRPSPLKVAHLGHSPYVSCSYWTPAQDWVVFECDAGWLDPKEHGEVWELFCTTPPPAGYDPSTIWTGPDANDFAVLRLDPWRIRIGRAEAMAKGDPPVVWTRPA